MKVKVISAFVPLNVVHSTPEKYHELADRMAACTDGDFHFFKHEISECWLYKWLNGRTYPPANPNVPADRYPSPQDNVMSNIVQHNRTHWAMQAAEADQDADVFVWIDYGVLKQGAWTGRPVQEGHIEKFLDKIRACDSIDNIPFPAIWGKGEISDTDVNWRFVGSVHIWPRKFLPAIDAAYKEETIKFIQRTRTIPNDLPIWAHVEANNPHLPFEGYSANHDATQFTNFRGSEKLTPLCLLAKKHLTDKGPYHGYTPVYYDLLKDRKDEIKRVLEIGIGYINVGMKAFWPFGASLRMWKEFLPNAHIYGYDILPEVMVNEDRISSVLADQSKVVSLVNATQALGGKFDLIIDDGSHFIDHQTLTTYVMLQYLAPGGIFVMEDLTDVDTYLRTLPPLPEGFVTEVYKSRAEPAHAHLVVIRHG